MTVQSLAPARTLAVRRRGQSHGFTTRLLSPGDLGEVAKPFVFLDLFDTGSQSVKGFGPHPHSGIATLTYLIEGSVGYEDTTGASGVLDGGGVEWMQAGRGAWHSGGPNSNARTRGFQLWVSLPPEHELGPSSSLYLPGETLPRIGPATLLLGQYGGQANPIPLPVEANYLFVRLKAGERWTYAPSKGHRVLWTASASGMIDAGGRLVPGEIGIFDLSEDVAEFVALEDSEFVVGSAKPQVEPLVLGYYSVHSSLARLAEGEAEIDRLARRRH